MAGNLCNSEKLLFRFRLRFGRRSIVHAATSVIARFRCTPRGILRLSHGARASRGMTVSTLFMCGKLGSAATLSRVTAILQPSVFCQLSDAMGPAEMGGSLIMERDSRFRPITGMLHSDLSEAVWLWTLHHGASISAARTRQFHHSVREGAGLGAFLRSPPWRRNDSGGEQGFERPNGRPIRYWECVSCATTRTNLRNLCI